MQVILFYDLLFIRDTPKCVMTFKLDGTNIIGCWVLRKCQNIARVPPIRWAHNGLDLNATMT